MAPAFADDIGVYAMIAPRWHCSIRMSRWLWHLWANIFHRYTCVAKQKTATPNG